MSARHQSDGVQSHSESNDPEPLWARLRRGLIGRPRDLQDRSLLHRLSLIPFLAWVALGADGLSSSCYGPEEAFKTLGGHTYLALALAGVMAATVFIIAVAYSRVIEHFPHGGGGYVVATKLLGRRAGVVSGCALLVDYVLTITISIAAAGDALFSFVPLNWHGYKLALEIGCIAGLVILNFRGVRESTLVLTPVFLLFVMTHLVLIGGGIAAHGPELPTTLRTAGDGFASGWSSLGLGGMVLLFLHAYSLGGGTYTGIEAVSNGLTIMREPRVRTGKRTMLYMAVSLAFTASGLLLCYLLWNVRATDGKTMNAVLAEEFVKTVPLGSWFVIATLLAEGALLVVAAQAGFVDGPRVLANMALDNWVPKQFASLSDRLTTQNGIVLMGATALAALLYTHGDVRQIVVMYSINVFLTFSMTETAMCRMYFQSRRDNPNWKKKISIHVVGLTMCLTILIVTVLEKFSQGGWLTLLITLGFVVLCFVIGAHYRRIQNVMGRLDRDFESLMTIPQDPPDDGPALDPSRSTAIIMVNGYNGLGIHTVLHVYRSFRGQFHNVVFATIGMIDSGTFKGADEMDSLARIRLESLEGYRRLGRRMGYAVDTRISVGTDVVDETEKLIMGIRGEFSQCVVFAGKLIFQRESWYHRLLHNKTAFAIQNRLQWRDTTVVILPIRVRA